MYQEEAYEPTYQDGNMLLNEQIEHNQEEQDQMYVEKLRKSGSAFVAYIRHNYLKGDSPKINFSGRDLKHALSNLDFTEKPILVLVHRPETAGIQQTISRLVTDRECSKMINDCFYPIGILSTSREIKTVLKFVPLRNIPCILVLRMTEDRRVKADDLILLSGTLEIPSVSIDRIHTSLARYLKKRNDEGSNFAIIQTRASDIDRQ